MNCKKIVVQFSCKTFLGCQLSSYISKWAESKHSNVFEFVGKNAAGQQEADNSLSLSMSLVLGSVMPTYKHVHYLTTVVHGTGMAHTHPPMA